MPMRGFTLIELLLTIALVALVAAGGFVVRNGIVVERSVRSAATVSLAAARYAQASALALRNDIAWSVRVSSASATVFAGTDWDLREPSYDSEYPFEVLASVTPSVVTFRRLSGMPDEDYEIVFTQQLASASLFILSDGRFELRTP